MACWAHFTDHRPSNFRQADIKMAEEMSKKLGRPVSPDEVKKWKKEKGYVWHENSEGIMQKIPHDVHANIPRSGGVSAYLHLKGNIERTNNV